MSNAETFRVGSTNATGGVSKGMNGKIDHVVLYGRYMPKQELDEIMNTLE
jgi:hypothetical protein